MKLTDLEPSFLKITSATSHQRIDNIKEADGIIFLCPLCFQNEAKTGRGAHSVICWQPHVPQTMHQKPGRWAFSGTGYDDLELRAGSSSILLQGGCNAHFCIRNGQISFT